MVWLGELDLKSRITLTLAIALGSGGLALAVRARVVRPLQTLANLTASLRERDYAVRGRTSRSTAPRWSGSPTARPSGWSAARGRAG